MNNSPEEIESQKARAFRPPEVSAREDLLYLLKFGLISITIYLVIYSIIGVIYFYYTGQDWDQLIEFITLISFIGTIIFGIMRTLRFSMAQTASSAYMIFPMQTKNVRGHLRDLVHLATALEWDLTGLIGSFTVMVTLAFLF